MKFSSLIIQTFQELLLTALLYCVSFGDGNPRILSFPVRSRFRRCGIPCAEIPLRKIPHPCTPWIQKGSKKDTTFGRHTHSAMLPRWLQLPDSKHYYGANRAVERWCLIVNAIGGFKNAWASHTHVHAGAYTSTQTPHTHTHSVAVYCQISTAHCPVQCNKVLSVSHCPMPCVMYKIFPH